MSTGLKFKLTQHLREKLNSDLEQLLAELSALDGSKSSETKSSAGDKYETSREMIQQERDKLEERLALTKRKIQTLKEIKPEIILDKAQLGSLIETDKSAYFICFAEGLIKLDGKNFKVISMASPIGQALRGKKAGEMLNWNTLKEEITSIC